MSRGANGPMDVPLTSSCESLPTGNAIPPGSAMRPSERKDLLYAMITSGPEAKDIIMEYSLNSSPATDNLSVDAHIARKVMQSLDPTDAPKSYVINNTAVHFLVDPESNLWFICLADKAMQRRLPFAFLEELVKGMETETLNMEILKATVSKYTTADNDKVARLTAKTNEIQENLLESIEKLMDRGDAISLLKERSEDLSNASASFRKEAIQVRREFQWRNIKFYLILAAIVVPVIFIIVWMSCR